ncbi:Aste57867_3237 [Aphanomyces stellatus]|uniref:Aste57867_3237 protein n=1 Tax=Aphanomyces stellatus TaxID=120398 RepID=A0A485KEQ9_9STRA|nr:hypothetical protein As57867_003227 [Aphanomyces stellatus]VFT80411.1 Aste57867_3237 [Aphanomyces stellatus]
MNCLTLLDVVPPFVDAFLPRAAFLSMPDIHAVASHFRPWTCISFKMPGCPMTRMSSVESAFEMADGLDFWAWRFAYQWATGCREIVALAGNCGTLRVLSTVVAPVLFHMIPSELPCSLSLYVVYGVQYVTGVVVVLAVVVVVLTILGRGGCIVWVGRPLLLLRALSAFCMLSTSQLALVTDATASLSRLATPAPAWAISILTTILVSGEVCWLSNILQGMASVVTQAHTRHYSSKSNYIVWNTTAVLALVVPLQARTTFGRERRSTVMDYSFACSAGVVAIGSSSRLVTLVGLTIASIVGSFGIEWCRRPHLTAVNPPSLNLNSLAADAFALEEWTHGIVYLVLVSAFLNGLVVLDVRHLLYMHDVKTWRTYKIQKSRNVQSSFGACVPLSE